MSESDHILIVEDEPITREQLVSYFEDEGFRVSSTGSGDEVQKIVDDSDVIHWWLVLQKRHLEEGRAETTAESLGRQTPS